MAPRDELEHYEATEVQDLTRLLRTLRPLAREGPVPPPVDLAIRAAIWKAPVQRQVCALLVMARRDLLRVIRQALTENPLLAEAAPAEDGGTPAVGAHAPGLATAADDLVAAAARYDGIWQACVADGWEAADLPPPADEAPGASEHPIAPPEIIVPDVMVTPMRDASQVVLNEEGIPRLCLRATARRMVGEGQGSEPEGRQYLDAKLRAAVWLIRSLEHRRQTLLKVATRLVQWQRDALTHGLAHLKPLALTEVAEALGMHALTVRLVITDKYLSTVHGVVALTDFFPRGLASAGGEPQSSLTVKDRIKQLVAAEDPATPLTDQQLAEVLAAEDIKIARRTVTKYRCELKMPPASRRQPYSSTAGASRLSPDEEQRVCQALEAHARRRQAEPPPQSDPEEASEIPPEVQEAQHHRDQEALAWLHLQSIEWWRLAADAEVRAAYRDLQAALAHPQLRPAVLMALRAFAQAAQAGATPPPPAAPIAPVPSLQEPPAGQAFASRHDLRHLAQLAMQRAVALLDVEAVSIILLDDARQELYVAVADEPRPGHESRQRGVRFPATAGVAGWVIREGRSLIVPDVDQDPRFYRSVDVQAGRKTRSLVCVPLRTQERIIGALEAINKRQGPFTAEDLRRLETFAHELARALERARAIQERDTLDVQPRIAEAERFANRAVPVDPLRRESPRMQEVSRLVARVLHTTATVLLTGERGTGKGRLTRHLHAHGPRAQGPFIAVNCAALPETRLEAELFGDDERGALTGATRRQPGCLELAAGGTLVLEEIHALSPRLQGKLLRVLQEHTFTRLGGTEPLTTDARIIAATSQDLGRLVDEGTFRRDLYDRLNVRPIALPPLRERREDLRALTLHFLTRDRREGDQEVLGVSEDAIACLERYSWPGNVGELQEVIAQAVARCQGPTVTAQDLPPALREPSPAPVSSGEAVTPPPGGIALADLGQQVIRQALAQARGNKTHAAQLLGLSRTQLRARMRQYGLETD